MSFNCDRGSSIYKMSHNRVVPIQVYCRHICNCFSKSAQICIKISTWGKSIALITNLSLLFVPDWFLSKQTGFRNYKISSAFAYTAGFLKTHDRRQNDNAHFESATISIVQNWFSFPDWLSGKIRPILAP